MRPDVLALLLVVAAAGLLGFLGRLRPVPADPEVRFAARLTGSDGVPVRGRVALAAGGAVWHPRRGTPAGLTGPVLLDPVVPPRSRRPDRRLQLRTAGGDPALLDLRARDASAVARVLSGVDVPGLVPWRARHPGRRRWGAGALVAGVCWAAFLAFPAVDASLVTATVVNRIDGWSCEVSWTDQAGQRQQDESDCAGERPGELIEVSVPPGDFRGGVTTPGAMAVVGVGGAVPWLVAGAVRLAVITRRRRRDAALLVLTGQAAPGRAARGGAAAAVPATAAALTRRGRQVRAVLGAGVLCAVAFGSLLWVMDLADRDLRATGTTVPGAVVEVHRDSRYSYGAADVRFRASGGARVERVALGAEADGYEPDDRVEVVYDPADPTRLTIDDVGYAPPWTHWPAVAAFVGGFVAFLVGPWWWLVQRRTRRVLAEGEWKPVRVRVWSADKRTWFRTPDGSTWKAPVGGWRRFDPRPGGPGDGLRGPDGDGQDAWWVRSGDVAVFSADQGHPLVLARLR